MKYSANLPVGPFKLIDQVRNDVSVSILKELIAEQEAEKYETFLKLHDLVNNNKLGRKVVLIILIHVRYVVDYTF